MDSIRDAFLKTDKGNVLVVEAKARKIAIAKRIRQLKQMVHDTFVGPYVPEGFNKRFDIYQRAKSKCRELGVKGGSEYEAAMAALKFTWASKRTYREVIEILE